MCPPVFAVTLAALMVLSSAGPGANKGAQGAKHDEFCVDLHKLAEMQPAGFNAVRGPTDGPPSDDGFQFYDAQLTLPGADRCKVWLDLQEGGWGYDCSWRITDSASGERQFTMLMSDMTSCFPYARTDRPWAGRFSIDSPHIKIRFRDTGRLSGIVLTIE